jgi:hypothetical protein
MVKDVMGLSSKIKPRIPVRTGASAKTFGSRVIGTGVDITGQVGWYDDGDPWYPNIVENGARRHSVIGGTKSRTRSARARFEKRDAKGTLGTGQHIFMYGHWVTKAAVNGFSARGFMAAGYSAMEGQIHADMARAAEAVVNELAVK